MARAPDPRIDEAKAMYLKGVKLVEIAHQLDLPEGTVRRWKSTHKWESERSDRKSERSKRKRGHSRAIKTVPEVRRETRKQLPQGSLRLSFLIAWNRKSGSWLQLSRRIKSSCSSRKSGC